MSESPATCTYLPWFRRGISTRITRKEGDGTTGPRADVSVTLLFKQGAGQQKYRATAGLALYGPGEVTGLDPRVVIRTWPRAGVHDAQPNCFPLIEFDQPDLPWRYTPAADGKERLKPWTCLIVLADTEFKPEAAGPDGSLPAIRVEGGTPLPDLSQSWAWAHMQVSGEETIDETGLQQLLESHPERVVARLLCPRHLRPQTSYTAFLVPAFERGRLAGLGRDVGKDVDALTPSWRKGNAPEGGLRLPAYFQWQFGTGRAGDFEALVKQLEARPLPAGVGAREMDASDPGAGLPAATEEEKPLLLAGALKPPGARRAGQATHKAFLDALVRLINRPAELLKGKGTRTVAPPLYGQWHAASPTLEPGSRPRWFHELNADPAMRVAAGLGTQVVQRQQQQLMAGAWRQVEGIVGINEQLRAAQVAREAASQLFERDVALDDPEAVLEVTAPVHARIRHGKGTIARQLRESPIAEGVFEPQFRRVARGRGPIGKRQGRPRRPRTGTLLARTNRGDLSAAPPPPESASMATLARAGSQLAPGWIKAGTLEILRPVARWGPAALGGLLLPVAAALLLTGTPAGTAAVPAAIGVASLGAAGLVRRSFDDLHRRAALRDGVLTCEQIRRAPPDPGFVPGESPSGSHVPHPPDDVEAGPEPGMRLRDAACKMLNAINTPPAGAAPLRRVDLGDLGIKIIHELDPRRTIPASYRRRLRRGDGKEWKADDPIEPIMAAPEFPQPMYEPLAEISQDWLLPGLERVSPDTVALLATNRQFVEAYMIGLNHEMARELLWNEYPTDQRGSYFRQFWDPRGFIGPIDRKELEDIKPIHRWGKRARLGENGARRPPGGEQLVLLIRGELLRRYPNTLVYAVRAELGKDSKRREPGGEERHPVFSGRLEPDVVFFGFELTAAQVRGTGRGKNQGWFFVIQEQPSEPCFGLDTADEPGGEPGTWDDLSWGHLAKDETELDASGYIDLDARLPDTKKAEKRQRDAKLPGVAWHADRDWQTGSTGTCASHVAYVTRQKPVRVAIHGSDMLPPA